MKKTIVVFLAIIASLNLIGIEIDAATFFTNNGYGSVTYGHGEGSMTSYSIYEVRNLPNPEFEMMQITPLSGKTYVVLGYDSGRRNIAHRPEWGITHSHWIRNRSTKNDLYVK